MKINTFLAIAGIGLSACNQPKETTTDISKNIKGTWRLKSSFTIMKGDTIDTSPVKSVEMIKIINDTHFAFFKHDLNQGKKIEAVFDAGAGTYKLSGETYTENLEYCNLRDWENHSFDFTLKLTADTLTQRGIEKIDNLNVNREIIEIYVRKGK